MVTGNNGRSLETSQAHETAPAAQAPSRLGKWAAIATAVGASALAVLTPDTAQAERETPRDLVIVDEANTRNVETPHGDLDTDTAKAVLKTRETRQLGATWVDAGEECEEGTRLAVHHAKIDDRDALNECEETQEGAEYRALGRFSGLQESDFPLTDVQFVLVDEGEETEDGDVKLTYTSVALPAKPQALVDVEERVGNVEDDVASFGGSERHLSLAVNGLVEFTNPNGGGGEMVIGYNLADDGFDEDVSVTLGASFGAASDTLTESEVGVVAVDSNMLQLWALAHAELDLRIGENGGIAPFLQAGFMDTTLPEGVTLQTPNDTVFFNTAGRVQSFAGGGGLKGFIPFTENIGLDLGAKVTVAQEPTARAAGPDETEWRPRIWGFAGLEIRQ